VNETQQERPLRIEAAADYLGVTVRWMRRAVENELIAYHRMGRYLLFLPSDLRAYMASTRVEPGGKGRTIDLRLMRPTLGPRPGPTRASASRGGRAAETAQDPRAARTGRAKDAGDKSGTAVGRPGAVAPTGSVESGQAQLWT